MIIAREKKKENIVEYVLYMWQIEDVIRSHDFNIEAIEKNVISQFDVSVEVKLEMKGWYEKLIADMKSEGVAEKGHLGFLREHVDGLNSLHHRLLTIHQDDKYQALYYEARKNIDEISKKSGKVITNDVEACLTGLYGLLVLKLKKAAVSQETMEAMNSFSQLLASLSKQYQLYKKGELTLSGVRNN